MTKSRRLPFKMCKNYDGIDKKQIMKYVEQKK